MKCPDCKNKTQDCPRCGASVEIQKVHDTGFHNGLCLVCKTVLLEPCPEVHRNPTRREVVMMVGREIARRINWRLVLDWVAALSTLAFLGALAGSWASCDGTVVRGLFWLECLK